MTSVNILLLRGRKEVLADGEIVPFSEKETRLYGR